MPKMSRPAFFFVHLLLCFVLLGSFIAWAQRPDPPPQPNQGFKPIVPPSAMQVPGTQRIREGTALRNTLVFFRQSGDRTVLYTVEDNRHFTCLENLALERILTAIQEKPERRYWRIDGEFTEFRGANFVVIRRYSIAPAPAATPPVGP